MLVQFSVKNYKVFKEEQVFSMLASTKYTTQDNHTAQNKDYKLLKGGVLYGANASGKSALLDAMNFFKTFIYKSSTDFFTQDKIPVHSFKLSTSTDKEPSMFEIIFIHNKIQYRYGFEVNEQMVVEEWFFVKDKRETEYFYRDEDGYDVNKASFQIGKLLIDQKMVRPNALLLSVAAQFNDPTAKAVLEWLDDFNVINGLYSDMYNHFTASQSKKNSSFKKNVLALLQRADLNINDFSIQERNREELPEFLKLLDDRIPLGYTIKTFHRKYDENNTPLKEQVVFDMEEEESQGTQKYFHLAGPLIHTLNNGGVLVVDELNARLHTKLVSSIVGLFHNPAINTKAAQLIITTHDTNLLAEESYRRDQIWFVNKNRYGASSLYSLNSFASTQGNQNHEKKYLEGRYKAVPYIHDMNQLLSMNQ